MEELDLNNILSPEEVDNLFDEEGSKTQETPPEPTEDDKKNNETTEVQVDAEDLFESESVGSGKEDKQGKEDTSPDGTGTSPKTNFYSSIASALKEDGIFQNLDDSKASEIKDAESFAQAIRDEVSAQFDERQKRIDEALNAGIEPSEIQKYERTLNYLDSIKDENISDESEQGEQLRRQLIYNDFINRGYSKERAQREVKKSFDTGTDIEDAKESLKSNKEFFKSSYDSIVEEAKKEEEKEIEERKKDAETLKKNILEEEKVFGELQIDKATRQKVFDNVSKPVYKDPETGELFTALQKYEMDNRLDFLKNVGLIYTLTDGFKNLDGLIKGKVKKEVRKGLRELETTINNTARTADGNLKFATGVDEDPESYVGKGWHLDV
jgi:hypothetical protein|nr:MAG TPA: hypothetical protein [Crassvirales sp.]